ncbi:hypothetical protein VP01_2263g4, partial [Puccinia sorghi]
IDTKTPATPHPQLCPSPRNLFPSSTISNQRLIGTMLPLLSISEKGFQVASPTNLHLPVNNSKCFNNGFIKTLNSKVAIMKRYKKYSLKYKSPKICPSKPVTPSNSTSSFKLQRTTKIALFRNRECQINLKECFRRKKEGLCLYCGGQRELDSCSRRITFLSSLILQINLTGQSLTLTERTSFPVSLVSSLKEPSFWISKKSKWTFIFSIFPSFKCETVLDAPGMDETIVGHDFLIHWNPDVDWQEGVINL